MRGSKRTLGKFAVFEKRQQLPAFQQDVDIHKAPIQPSVERLSLRASHQLVMEMKPQSGGVGAGPLLNSGST